MISVNLLCKKSLNKMLINYWGLFSRYSSFVCFPTSSTLLPQGGHRRDRKNDVVCNVFLGCWQKRVAWEPTGLWVPSFFPFFFLLFSDPVGVFPLRRWKRCRRLAPIQYSCYFFFFSSRISRSKQKETSIKFVLFLFSLLKKKVT